MYQSIVDAEWNIIYDKLAKCVAKAGFQSVGAAPCACLLLPVAPRTSLAPYSLPSS